MRRRSADIVPLRGHRRPAPPPHLIEEVQRSLFVPAPDLSQWLRIVFIEDSGPLHNPDHTHLAEASIGVLWTNVSNSRQGRRIVGQAELGGSMGGNSGGRWQKAKTTMLLQQWFGEIEPPDFVMTLDANYAGQCDDVSFCALVEHELYHMAQALDVFGMPKFTRTGKPVFGMRGHDVEEFVGVVRRYGVEASNAAALVEAANKGPEVALASIAQACGTCQARHAA